jgi:HAD superfamily hydrolase (TIGR01484 family)
MIQAIFSDIDNTLIFKAAHDPSGTRRVSGEDRYVANRVVELAERAASRLYLITGRRRSGFDRLARLLPHAYGIIEHGCLIVDGYGGYRRDWLDLLIPYVGMADGSKEGLLWEYERQLNEAGYQTDSVGRLASFRVDPTVNRLTAEALDQLEKRQHPVGIRTTRNLGSLDFLPERAGKLNCIRFICEQEGFGLRDVACLGDDMNDLDMLSACGHPFTHAGALPEVVAAVRKAGGYVSKCDGHDAAVDLLQHLACDVAL